MHTHRSCDVILILFFFMIKHLVPLKILKCYLMSAYTIEHLNPFWSRNIFVCFIFAIFCCWLFQILRDLLVDIRDRQLQLGRTVRWGWLLTEFRLVQWFQLKTDCLMFPCRRMPSTQFYEWMTLHLTASVARLIL